MAKFVAELPNQLIKELEKLEKNTTEMMGEMTRAGAEIVKKNVEKNMDKVFDSTDRLKEHLIISKTFRTPTDDSINNKVMFTGYLDNDKKKPVPLIVNAREYGTSRGEAKKPFFRKSFNKKQIEEAMRKIEEKYLPKE